MNCNTMRLLVMTIVLGTSITTHCMFLALAKRTVSPYNSITKRSFHNNIPKLCTAIFKPTFKLTETKKIIKTFADGDLYEYGADNKLIEHIVFKATEHRKSEKKYASVLRQLREHGWTKSSYCKTVMLHSAVISNLPNVTQELLLHDSNWVHEKDLHDCVPIDYAKSTRIKKMLKDAGSRDSQPYTGEDLWYRVPGHGWQVVTPLRKAVYNGDWKLCQRILSHFTIRYYENDDVEPIKNEAEILLALADLRFWRTDDKKYLEIKKQIEAFYQDHLDWLESNIIDSGAACDPFWFSRLEFK